VTVLNLRTIKLRSGEEYRGEQEIELEPVRLAGQRYLPVPDKIPAELAVIRASTGTVFELSFIGRLHGPCFRCLNETAVEDRVAAREYQATSPGESEELRTPYLEDDQLDLSSWARDALVLALPGKILCRPDCAGLCPMCGLDLNVEPHEHDEERADPRWSALAELRKYAPNLTADKILATEIRSPLDLERINWHNWHGSCHGGDMSPSQSETLRPVPGYAQHRMPIPGLYQTGATTHPGGSVTGAPGRNAALAVLSDMRRGRRQ